MRFHAEHRFAAPVEAVVALLVDPDFHRQLELPDMSLRDVDGSTEGDRSHLTLRYEYVGHLDPIARRLLAGRDLTWRQELDIDRSTGSGRLSFQAEADPGRLHGTADVSIDPADGGSGSVRVLDGELVVAVPLIGGRAERQILPGLVRRLHLEAQALDDRLRG
jgi:uncharacterized protein DUF2505